MRVAIAGRMSLRQLADLLDEPVAAPAGLAGTAPLPEVRVLIARGHDVSLVTLDPDLTSEVVLRGDRLTVYVCALPAVSRRPRRVQGGAAVRCRDTSAVPDGRRTRPLDLRVRGRGSSFPVSPTSGQVR
jgi:hypothetical protein